MKIDACVPARIEWKNEGETDASHTSTCITIRTHIHSCEHIGHIRYWLSSVRRLPIIRFWLTTTDYTIYVLLFSIVERSTTRICHARICSLHLRHFSRIDVVRIPSFLSCPAAYLRYMYEHILIAHISSIMWTCANRRQNPKLLSRLKAGEKE